MSSQVRRVLALTIIGLAAAVVAGSYQTLAQAQLARIPVVGYLFAEPTAVNAKPVIALVEDPWQVSVANNALAKVLLEDELGYQVRLITLTTQHDLSRALIVGDASASMVLWTDDLGMDLRRYLTADIIRVAGPLGVRGRAGWFVPSYVLKDYPQLTTWESLKDPAIVKLFAEGTDGPGIIVSGDPLWNTHIEEIIVNLTLPYKVRYTGSEAKLIDEIERAYRERQPLLFYLWEPHPLFKKYELTKVRLPSYSKECYALAEVGGVNCDYPIDPWLKLVHPGLEQAAPDAYRLIQRFKFSSNDQQAQLVQAVIESATPEEGARRWMREHESVWQAWLAS